MSTYAVWGMTRAAAIELAKKIADRQVSNSDESKWLKVVTIEASKIMASRKIVMLSEKYDAPNFAYDFKELAGRTESRDLHVKGYCRTGDHSPKTGKPKMHWVAA